MTVLCGPATKPSRLSKYPSKTISQLCINHFQEIMTVNSLFQKHGHTRTCPDIGISTATGVPSFTLTSARLQFEQLVLENV